VSGSKVGRSGRQPRPAENSRNCADPAAPGRHRPHRSPPPAASEHPRDRSSLRNPLSRNANNGLTLLSSVLKCSSLVETACKSIKAAATGHLATAAPITRNQRPAVSSLVFASSRLLSPQLATSPGNSPVSSPRAPARPPEMPVQPALLDSGRLAAERSLGVYPGEVASAERRLPGVLGRPG
jgi:hypothetical protein